MGKKTVTCEKRKRRLKTARENGTCTWRSPEYTENPMEYIKQGSEYLFYVWGKYCCMGLLEKEETVCERMPAMKGRNVEILSPIERFGELSEEEKKAAEDIAREMKTAAQKQLGKVPVTEVLVYLS